MSRLSQAVKDTYELLESAAGPDACYYCGKHAVMHDTTPNHKVDPAIQANFTEERTIVKVCQQCWHKIYTANLINGGARFGVQPGLMTLEHKRIATGNTKTKGGTDSVLFVFMRNIRMLVPTGTHLDEQNGSYFWESEKIFPEEMEMLQPVMLMKSCGYDRSLYMTIFGILINDPEERLNPARMDLYRKMLREEVAVRKDEGGTTW